MNYSTTQLMINFEGKIHTHSDGLRYLHSHHYSLAQHGDRHLVAIMHSGITDYGGHMTSEFFSARDFSYRRGSKSEKPSRVF